MSGLRQRLQWGLGFALLSGVFSLVSSACTQDQVTVAVRSLERSGRATFVCLAPPSTLPTPGVPLDHCDRHITEGPSSYAIDSTGAIKPHLYSLVTQTVRGEVAVIDLTANIDSVIDQDTSTPGATFLPVGAQPVDIVTTPGGTASFVAVAEIGRPGIYALPSDLVRPSADRAAPTLTTWPACLLPSAPSSMLVLADPAKDGLERATCDGAYGDAAPADEREEPNIHGNLSLEGGGRLKLVATLPELGQLAVIDAQRLLDRKGGTFGPCPIDRMVPLEVDLPIPTPSDPPPAGPVCVNPEPVEPGSVAAFSSQPAGLSFSEGRLYVADLGAPVIHVLDMPSPCDASELPSLLPTSVLDPTRVVLTSRVATSPRVTADFKRFLYANDVEDGSAMVFDISDDAPSRTPLVRPTSVFNPFIVSDRIQFGGTVRDIVLIERDVAATDPATGVATSGIACDPDPSLTTCSSTSSACDVETLYRTSASYDTGAGPLKLRGQFAFLLLSTGQIAVIDIEDYDAACRGPTNNLDQLGCPGPISPTPLARSAETSCNIVEPHTPRSALYSATNDYVGRHAPGVQTFPILADSTGTIIEQGDPSSARMHATIPVKETPNEVIPQELLTLNVGALYYGVDEKTGLASEGVEPRHTLLMNLEDPRAQVADQAWSAIYEGALLGTVNKLADLRMGAEPPTLTDPNTRFCGIGVQSRAMMREQLASEGVPEAELDAQSLALADRLQIVRETPGQSDDYWGSTASCTYQECNAIFGTSALPNPARDLVIEEAYQDHLELGHVAIRADTNGDGAITDTDDVVVDDAKVECCFPTLVTFNVRAAGQWLVLGDASGVLHHIIADPETGACRPSCDAGKARLNSRLRETPFGETLNDGDPRALINPMFRFSIARGQCVTDCDTLCGGQASCELPSRRGDQFRFVTQGSFSPLVVELRTDTNDVQPQSIGFLPPTGEVYVTDGSLEGLMLVSPASVALNRKYF